MREPQPILALDLGCTTGWAVGRDFARPSWGVWRLGAADQYGNGRRLSCLANSIERAITVHNPERIIFEAPLARGDNATRLLFYFAGIVELIASECGVPYVEEHVGTVRKLVLGHGSPRSADPKRPKQPMVEWCRAQGWQVEDDNAADALVLLRYAHVIGRSKVTAGAMVA